MKYEGILESAFGFNPGAHVHILRLIFKWTIQPLSSNEPDLMHVVRISCARLEHHINPLMFFEIADALSVNIPLDTPAELS